MRLIETLQSDYIEPKNWMEDINNNDKEEQDDEDPEPERYYEWMLWKLRQERKKDEQSNI